MTNKDAPKNSGAKEYEPAEYWENRLRKDFSLKGVGHISFGKSYNRWLYRAKRRTLSRYFNSTDVRGRQVLDVGCGTGFFVEWYLNRGAVVSGIDIAATSIGKLAQRFPGEFRVQDIASPDYVATRAYDIVNMWDVMYHIVDSDGFARAIANVARSLKEGGLFLLTDRFSGKQDLRQAQHARFRVLETYLPPMASAGFELVDRLFLYEALNRPIAGPFIDSRLGWLYYALDAFRRKPAPDNLSLAVWRRT